MRPSLNQYKRLKVGGHMEVLPCEPFQVSPKVINDFFENWSIYYSILRFFCYIQGMSKVTFCAETALNFQGQIASIWFLVDKTQIEAMTAIKESNFSWKWRKCGVCVG